MGFFDLAGLSAVVAQSHVLVVAARMFLVVLLVVLTWTLFTQRFRIDTGIRLGLALMWPAALSALDALLQDRPFLAAGLVAGRWSLAALGLLVVLLRIWWMVTVPIVPPGAPRPHTRRRLSDFVAVLPPKGGLSS